MKPWWQRCIWSALLNAAVWITPPPLHFLSLLLPYFSGYTIGLDRPEKSFMASVQIGFVMGLTLGSLILVPGVLLVFAISMFVSINLYLWLIIVAAVGVGTGIYTGIAAALGAFYAAYRHSVTAGRRGEAS